MFLHKNICCDPSLELSHRDSSNEGSQLLFSLRKEDNFSLNHPEDTLLSITLTPLVYTTFKYGFFTYNIYI